MSIFTKIIAGELPCYKIHEDDKTFSFLAIPPNQLGHTLVVPKKEIDHFIDVPEEIYLQVMKNAYKISQAIFKAVDCKRIGSMVQGFEVPHFHYHLIPLNSPRDLDFSNARERSSQEMKEVQKKILKFL